MKYLETSKLMTLSMLILQDEATEDVKKPEKIKHLTMCVTDLIDSLWEEDFKMIELEFNQFEMNDALEEMETLKKTYEETLKEYISEQLKPEALSYMVILAYVQEVWANLARSISVTEEELNSIVDVSTSALEILIRQTRKDIKKMKEAIDFIKKKSAYTKSLS